MRYLAIVGPIVCLTGCRSLLGIEDPTVVMDATASDTAVHDGPPDDGALCFGTGLVTICPQSAPPALVVSMPTTLLTDDATTCDAVVQQASNQPALCVRFAQTVTISATLRAIGTRPLVIVAESSLTVTEGGIIDVSSYRTIGGPGAGSSTACAGMAGTNNNAGSGGGAGGSFGSKGGNGGDGDMNAPGGIGMAPISIANVRGGCAGGTGGSSSGATGGVGGRGGGALYLIAGARIQIDGQLLANGAGGLGGQDRSGGGGGGSGGLIGLDAPDVRIGAGGVVQANGGGGGGGGTGGMSGSGGEPVPAQPLAPAPGAAALAGSSGGDGAAGSIAAESCTPADEGGGGGGGGGGSTRLYAMERDIDGTVSPPLAP